MNTIFDNNFNEVTGGTTLYDGALINYTVLPNDTLKSIAEKFGTKTGVLLELNPRIDASLEIRPGQIILVPAK